MKYKNRFMRQKIFSLRVKRPWYLFIRNGILLCSLFIASFVQAQLKNITIEFINELLAEALKKLEKLSSYKILFTYEEVQDYKVTASLKNATILEALGKVLEGIPFIHSDITDGKYISVKCVLSGTFQDICIFSFSSCFLRYYIFFPYFCPQFVPKTINEGKKTVPRQKKNLITNKAGNSHGKENYRTKGTGQAP